MGKEVDTKFTWVIKNFCSLQSNKVYSDEFIVDGCKWRLMAFPKGNNNSECLSLYLDVAGSESLPFGWKRHARVHLCVVNQVAPERSVNGATHHWFDESEPDLGFTSMINLGRLKSKNGGFMVNGQVKIIAKVDVLEVIGELDVPDEEETESLSTVKEDDDAQSNGFLEEASSVKESMEVNGFQVLPSQVESVSRIFERHPDLAYEFTLKNQHLRSAYMNVLLGLIDMLCQSSQELSKDDLTDAAASLEYLTNAGFDLDWLEEKLEQVSEMKGNKEAGETRVKEIEDELKELKLKCSNLEAELENKKADVSAARAPLSFNDVVRWLQPPDFSS